MEWSQPVNPLTILISIVAVVVGLAGWIRAGRTLRETAKNPVRRAQHDLLARLLAETDNLSPVLTNRINLNVQESYASETIRADADELEQLTKALTDEKVVDSELQSLLDKLRLTVFTSGDDGTGWIGLVRRYAYMLEEIDRLRSQEWKPDNFDRVLEVGALRGGQIEPIRAKNDETIFLADRIRKRIQYLQVNGFGLLSRPW